MDTQDEQTQALEVESQETPPAEQSTDQTPEGDQPEEEQEQEQVPDDIPADVLRKNLTEANREAAKYRTKLREVEALLSERKSPEEVEALVNELRTERETTERQLVVEVVALQHNVPKDMRDTLAKLAETGMSREELEKHAKAFGKFATKEVPDEPRGGLNPSTTPDDADDPRTRVRNLRRTRI